MRAIVGDILGRTKVIDLWNSDVTFRSTCEADRTFSVESLKMITPEKALLLHNCGKASFVDITGDGSCSTLDLEHQSRAFSIGTFKDNFVAVLDEKIVVFDQEKVLSSFEVLKADCGTFGYGKAALGRKEDRTLVYDVGTASLLWTAPTPLLDELGLPIEDKDRSVLMMDENILVVGQEDGFCLMYDIRTNDQAYNRYKVMAEFPVATLAKFDSDTFLAGDTIGSLILSDIRLEFKAHIVRGWEGSPAGVVAISTHKTLPYFATLSMDRVIRLYDRNNHIRTPVKQAFTKTMCNCIELLEDAVPEEAGSSDEEWGNLLEDTSAVWDDYQPGPKKSLSKSE